MTGEGTSKITFFRQAVCRTSISWCREVHDRESSTVKFILRVGEMSGHLLTIKAGRWKCQGGQVKKFYKNGGKKKKKRQRQLEAKKNSDNKLGSRVEGWGEWFLRSGYIYDLNLGPGLVKWVKRYSEKSKRIARGGEFRPFLQESIP